MPWVRRGVEGKTVVYDVLMLNDHLGPQSRRENLHHVGKVR